MKRETRVVSAFLVEYTRSGERVCAVSEDISRRGLFVRTDEFLPIGEVVELLLRPPDEEPVPVLARVAHVLSRTAAGTLGRSTGMGFEFLERDAERRERLSRMIEELIDTLTPLPEEMPVSLRVLAADSNLRMLERLSDILGVAGFVVEAAANGAEAYSACLGRRPDVILAADGMAVVDGRKLMQMLAGHPRLADVPVILISDEKSDIARLEAYRGGVADFIQTPFTDDEVAIRVWRVARAARSSRERAVLRGDLATIGLATLLSLLDFERKSGLLVVLRDADIARVFIAHGRVVRIEATFAGSSPRATLLKLLDITEGNFEFTACDVLGEDEVGVSTQHLLLEHARRADEGVST